MTEAIKKTFADKALKVRTTFIQYEFN